ncbi:hypothetical protein AB4212_33655 [Streptomyces sp. 2MCAF27]
MARNGGLWDEAASAPGSAYPRQQVEGEALSCWPLERSWVSWMIDVNNSMTL